MTGAKTEPKGQKARTSELAIASLVLSLLVPCGWFLVPALVDSIPGLPDSKVFAWLMGLIAAVASFWLAVPVLSIVALVKIKKSSGLLKGRALAIAGLCLWLIIVVPFVLRLLWPRHPGYLPPRVVCGTNMSGLAKAMMVYANDDDGRLPQAGKWCDVLIQADFTSYKQFVCPASDAIVGECSYAMNRNAVGKNMSALPADMVMLFETNFGRDPNGRDCLLKDRRCYESMPYRDPNTSVYKLRWNQVGGPEILTTENHKGKGCNVVFADTSVKFVKTKNLTGLLWEEPPPIHAAVTEGDINKVRSILSERPELVNLRDGSGRRALHRAAERGEKDMVELLIGAGAQVNAQDKGGAAPLHVAAGQGRSDTVELLIAKGAKVNLRNNAGAGPLQAAAGGGHKDVVELLIARGANVNLKDNKGLGVLHAAARSGQRDMAEVFISLGADVNLKAGDGRTALHLVAAERFGSESAGREMAELLIGRGADVNIQDNSGDTALHITVRQYHRELPAIAEPLLIAGADVTISNAEGRTALEIVEEIALPKGRPPGRYHKDLFFMLLKYAKLDPTFVNELPLVKSVLENKDAALLGADLQRQKHVVEFLVANGADVNARDKYGRTVLHRAARAGQKDMVELVLAAGARVNAQDNSERTPLESCHEAETARVLREHGGVSIQGLISAARDSRLSEIEFVLSKDPNLASVTGRPQETLLHAAAEGGNKELVGLLIRHGINVNSRDHKGQTPLHRAAGAGQRDAVEVLLAAGADVQARDHIRRTALHEAAGHGQKDVVKLLLAAGADVRAGDLSGFTAAYYAARIHDDRLKKDMVELLEEHGGVHIPTLMEDIRKGRLSKVTARLDKDPNLASVTGRAQETLLHAAAEGGNKELVGLLIKHGINVNARDHKGQTPLHRAARAGQRDAAEVLLAAGADVQARDHDGRTAADCAVRIRDDRVKKEMVELLEEHGGVHIPTLMEAAKKGRLTKIAALLDKDPNLVNAAGYPKDTLLHVAAEQGDCELAALLINRGADLNARDHRGQTALHRALDYNAGEKHKEIVELLVAAGADVRSGDGTGRSVLNYAMNIGDDLLKEQMVDLIQKRGGFMNEIHSAVQQGETAKVKTLLADKPELVNARTIVFGQTALHLAVEYGHTEIAELLIAAGADINAKTYGASAYNPRISRGQYTALHQAVESNRQDLLELLIARGADLNARNEPKKTALHLAARKGYTMLCELLVAAGADVNTKDDCDATALHWAAYRGDEALVRLFIANGSDVNAKTRDNCFGMTVLHAAAREGHENLVELLIATGADVNARNRDGHTALNLAEQRGHKDTADSLRSHGAIE